MSIEAMKQALEALEKFGEEGTAERYSVATKALRQAIAEAEKQEPVGINGLTEAETNATASVMGLVNKKELVCVCGCVWEGQELVESPPQRQWVGLTQYEISEIWADSLSQVDAIKSTEAKLKEKNNG